MLFQNIHSFITIFYIEIAQLADMTKNLLCDLKL